MVRDKGDNRRRRRVERGVVRQVAAARVERRRVGAEARDRPRRDVTLSAARANLGDTDTV